MADKTGRIVDEKGSITVYFDGACPLCRREIGVYRNMTGAEHIVWEDVSAAGRDQIAADLTRVTAIRRFHVRRRDGRLVSGALAFSELWRAFPTLSWLGRVTSLPGIRHAAEATYRCFLLIRPFVQRITPR